MLSLVKAAVMADRLPENFFVGRRAIFSAPEPGLGIISASCLLSAYTIQHPTQTSAY
jgi:hypothetical protein